MKELQEMLKLNDEELLEKLLDEYGYDMWEEGLVIPTKDFNISVYMSFDDIREYADKEDATDDEIFDYYCKNEMELDKHFMAEGIGDIREQIKEEVKEWLSRQEA